MVEENDQCPLWGGGHSPEASPTPPEPPDKPAQRCSKSPSIELEGERTAATSYDVERTRGDTVVSGVLAGSRRSCRMRQKNLQSEGVKKTHQVLVQLKKASRATGTAKRTHRKRQGVSREM